MYSNYFFQQETFLELSLVVQLNTVATKFEDQLIELFRKSILIPITYTTSRVCLEANRKAKIDNKFQKQKFLINFYSLFQILPQVAEYPVQHCYWVSSQRTKKIILWLAVSDLLASGGKFQDYIISLIRKNYNISWVLRGHRVKTNFYENEETAYFKMESCYSL